MSGSKEPKYSGDGVYSDISDDELKRLMERRKQRYTDGYNKPLKNSKTISSKLMVFIIICLLVYYLLVFVLNMTGQINQLTMFVLMGGVAAIAIIIYVIYRRKTG